MNKKMAATIAVGVLAVTMLAGWRGYGGAMDPAKVSRIVDARVDNTLDDVDATDAQRAQVKAVSQRLVKEGFELRKANKDTRKELLAQWESANPDKQKLHGIVDARAEELKAFAHKIVDGAVEIHGILNAGQRAILTEKIKDRMED